MKTANRIIALFLSVVIISTLLIPSVFAADSNVEFSSTKTSVNSGDTFVVSIKATDELTNVYSVGPLIRFDNTKLEVTNLKWNSSIPYVFPSTVETANTNGFFTTNYADNTTGAALDISAGDVFVEATFAVKSGASGSTEITTEAEFADEYGAEVADAILNQDKITITIVSSITGDLNVAIEKPVKGATPQSTITETAQYTGTIAWEGSPAAFDPGTVYTAKVDLTAKSGYQFASSVNPTVANATSITEKTVSPDGNTLTFKATFPATTDKDPASLADAPTGATGLTYNGTEQALLATNGTATDGTMQYSLNGTNWSTAVPKGKDAKTYTVYYMVKGDADHSDFTPADNTVTVTIDPKDIGDSDVTVDPIAAETYDGTAKTPAPVVKDGDDPLTLDTDYTVSYSNNTDAGNATVTIEGKGNYNGVIASEAANNGCCGGAMVPLLTLGIPGDAVTSVLIGGLTIQGLTPGSLLFTEHMDVVIGIFTTMFIATILMVLMQLFGMRLFIMVLNVPTNYLNSALVILSLVGSYALRNNIFDVAITIVLGLVGYLMQRGGFPTAPAVLGLVLGIMFEREVRMALQTSHNDWTIFLTRPVACVFVVLSVLFVANSLWKAWKDSKAEKAKAQA